MCNARTISGASRKLRPAAGPPLPPNETDISKKACSGPESPRCRRARPNNRLMETVVIDWVSAVSRRRQCMFLQAPCRLAGQAPPGTQAASRALWCNHACALSPARSGAFGLRGLHETRQRGGRHFVLSSIAEVQTRSAECGPVECTLAYPAGESFVVTKLTIHTWRHREANSVALKKIPLFFLIQNLLFLATNHSRN